MTIMTSKWKPRISKFLQDQNSSLLPNRQQPDCKQSTLRLLSAFAAGELYAAQYAVAMFWHNTGMFEPS